MRMVFWPMLEQGIHGRLIKDCVIWTNWTVKSVNPRLTSSSTLSFVYFSSKFLSIDPTLYSGIVVTVSSMTIFESFIWIGRIAPGSFWISIWISTKIMIYRSFGNIFRFMGIISIPFLAFSARFRFTLKRFYHCYDQN